MADTRKFDIAYTALTDLATDTSKTAGAVLCRVIAGIDVSFTRTNTTFLRFESPSWAGKKKLYDAAEFLSYSL